MAENPLLLSSSQQNMTAAARALIDSVRCRHVYRRKSSVPVDIKQLYESDIFITRQRSEQVQCHSNMWLVLIKHGRQTKRCGATKHNTRHNWENAARVTCNGGVTSFSIRQKKTTLQPSGKLFKVILHFSGGAPGRVRMKFCTYQALT